MTTLQYQFFPQRALPAIVEVFPSYIACQQRSLWQSKRLEGHYLATYAERVYRRILSYSGTNDLLETSGFVNLWFTFWNELESYKMSGKRAQTDQYKRPDWKGFLERTLSEDELAQCDDWKVKPAEIIEALCALAETGYDIKLSYNPQQKAGNCTLVDTRPKLPTTGYALSARGMNCADALKLAVYKHYHLLAQDWTPLLSNPPKSKRG